MYQKAPPPLHLQFHSMLTNPKVSHKAKKTHRVWSRGLGLGLGLGLGATFLTYTEQWQASAHILKI